MQAPEKAIILKAIKEAEATSLTEQKCHRKILTAICIAPVDDAALANQLDALGWERIEKHMKGHTWPPESQDWQLLQISWDQTPKQKALNEIADQDIRFATYFFSEISDHTKRLKALAHFYSLFAANNEDIALTFLAWAEGAKLKAMQLLDPSLPRDINQFPLL